MDNGRLSKQEAEKISVLYNDYAAGIYRLISCKIYWRSDDNIFECLHDTYVVLIEKFKSLFNIENIKAWLYKTAINITRNFNRKKVRYYSMHKFTDFDEAAYTHELATPKDYVENYVIEQEDLGQILCEVQFKMNKILNENQMELYYLKYINKLSNKEISKLCNKNEKTVSYQIKVIKNEIYRCIKEVMYN